MVPSVRLPWVDVEMRLSRRQEHGARPMRPRFLTLCMCLLSGGFYAALFPPLGWSWLAWFALAPLFVAFTRLRPPAAAAAGLVWALTATVGIAWWLPSTLERFFDVPAPAAWTGFLSLGLVIDGLPYAALGAWLAWMAQRGRPPIWAIAAAWGVAEYARVHVWVGNPFGLLAYGLHGTAFAQTADLWGPFGLGILVAAVNATIAGMAVPVLRARRPWRSVAAMAAITVAAFLYGAVRLTQQYGTGEAVKVAIVQTGIAREVHGNPELQHERLEQYFDLTRQAAASRPDIVFWPEYSIDFFLRDPSRERSLFLAEAQGLAPDLVLGGPDYRMRDGSPHFYNSVFLLRSGRLAGRHDKLRLVPFAEYGPLGAWLRSDTAVYEPGAEFPPLPARPARVGAFLCGEALYPDLVRALARQGAELLANPSNDYWLVVPEAAMQQVEVAAFRAIENRRYVVRATPTGTSAVIDPAGRVLTASHFGTPDLLFAEVYRSNVLTLYQVLGDGFVGAALLLVVVSSLSAMVRRSRP